MNIDRQIWKGSIPLFYKDPELYFTSYSLAMTLQLDILNQDQFSYYRFTAKPGKMPITLDIDPRDGDDHGANGANVEAVLEKHNGETIGNIAGFAGIPTPSRKVRRFEFKKETPVTLILNISSGTQSNYTCRLKIDGNWKELTKSESNLRVLNRPIY